MYKTIESIRRMNEKVTLLGIGPMSKTVVDASIESAMENDFPLCFIASRNQIEKNELGGGYVESWDSYDFSSYIDSKIKEVHYDGVVFKGRDHGGPWQKDEEYSGKIPFDESMKNATDSFTYDLEAGFDLLHIDTSKDPDFPGMVPCDIAVGRVIKLLAAIEKYKANRSMNHTVYEVSLEETREDYLPISQFKQFVELMVSEADKRKMPRPAFIVGNTGTLIRMDKNYGKFDMETVVKLKKISDAYGMILKEHNADYLDSACLKLHPELGIGMANVAPEFGKRETEALIKLYKMEEEFFSLHDVNGVEKSNFLSTVFSDIKKSGKWMKWVPNKKTDMGMIDDPMLKEVIISVNGHYFYSKDSLIKARRILFDNLRKFEICKDPDRYVKDNIKRGIQRYVDGFNLKNLSSKIREYQDYESKNHLKNSAMIAFTGRSYE
ncbi:D-tagatose-1,6-bisphosphate aldolase subunit GatZ [Ruminiclostridium hungatei]|uniref:D-tagatose-1,6-bisphosphate aldolase subunit GatZ n=1 Tax=Ruminiclostridium hungatei TaxID=48256 RepID=A0A1V4SPV0_RUMHU|nr:class II D-tagatose-bisphosphate aldolase, non-catalytic subunit [Ruminiclostridium hungatei]OPX45880.1 D-tagatose-1,6-bisphosphate aldolase subunit GatZ [Ruminiclostridium hungatei]